MPVPSAGFLAALLRLHFRFDHLVDLPLLGD